MIDENPDIYEQPSIWWWRDTKTVLDIHSILNIKIPENLLEFHRVCLRFLEKWPQKHGRGLLNFYAYYNIETIDEVIDVIKKL